jgi:hypothetical protein
MTHEASGDLDEIFEILLLDSELSTNIRHDEGSKASTTCGMTIGRGSPGFTNDMCEPLWRSNCQPSLMQIAASSPDE